MFVILPFSGASWFTVFKIVFGYREIAWYVRFLILCILGNVSWKKNVTKYYENKWSIMTMTSMYIVYIYKLYSMDFVW